ncbi:PAS domain S-box protein, partial [candidate division WOR-3 bacterium]|nr:PAS domain S-box protein [candidate division WOR-3 bacterium]
EDKTKEQLINEIVELHNRIAELEKSETQGNIAELENMERRLYLEAVLTNAPDAIITMDAQHKTIMCNQGAEELFGYSCDEMIGRDIDDLIAGADKFEEARDYSKLVLAGKNVSATESVRYRKDGSPVEVMVAGSPIFIGNKLVGAVAVYTDITELKRMKHEIEEYSQELEHKVEQLQKLNEELSQYTYAVSHDLRAPLRALINYSRFLQEDFVDKLNEIGKDYIQSIAENALYMEELVVDLLEYSRIGRIKPKIIEVDLGKLLDNIVSKLHPGENIQVTLPKKMPIIQASELHLEQIFSNLLSNAFKFNKTPKPQITVECLDKDNVWEFAVRDNGIGIDPKYFDKIFGIFQRLHTQEEYEGTGIGLAIVKKAIEEQGGTVWIESTPNKGSVFSFALPKKNIEQFGKQTSKAKE